MDVRLTIERLPKLRVMRVDRVILDGPRRNAAVVLFERGETLTDIVLTVYVADVGDPQAQIAVRRHLDPERSQPGWRV
ncbi:hypothetical protein CDN99_13735 [Roseateles aquatilis]|uniref:Uncharacterized protein n=1 Tax=Roseateles aquatilis TaxID=431061 RepID=A0A246JCS6_9BURK|nr:hypothetical protein [Roseateles aquatilis]OWQ90409.1 hypothetical protein CDN99_13735 [Roseateles aquatilis]